MRFKDLSDQAIKNAQRHGLELLVVVGGDGSLNIAFELSKKGLPVVGVPKTIDNDLDATDVTFGFDSALTTATDAVDKLHTTADSHHRLMVLELMGRYAGWIALEAGMAGGGDVILIPGDPVRHREGGAGRPRARLSEGATSRWSWSRRERRRRAAK